jgi:hypothetical protein
MTAAPIRYVGTVLAWAIGLLSALIGMIYLLSGAQAYLGADFTDTPAFVQLLLAIGFLCMPVGVFLLHKARHSFRMGFEKYSLPDPPVRSLSISAFGIALLIASASAFIIVFLLF